MIILLKPDLHHKLNTNNVKVFTYYEIETKAHDITKKELQFLYSLNDTTIILEKEDPNYTYVYIEPRLKVNAWSSNVKTICQKCNLDFIDNIKKGKLYQIPIQTTENNIILLLKIIIVLPPNIYLILITIK